MKIAVIACRILLGAGFVVFGSNIIHPFLPMPPMDPNSLPMKFGAVMGPTHWMALIGLFQLFGGLFVLSGRLAPIGLTLLGPVHENPVGIVFSRTKCLRVRVLAWILKIAGKDAAIEDFVIVYRLCCVGHTYV